MIPVNLDDLETAVEFASSGMPTDHRAYIAIDTGVIYWVSESSGIDEDAPKDLGDPDRYLEVPTKTDLGLGRPLALRFAEQHLPGEYERIWQFFAHRGAYARFKDLLDARGLLDAWYAFEAEGTARAIRDWCEAHEIKAIRENRAPTNESA
jgi:hypothetical protein